MKLFAFQPNGHGQSSFFVIAENESEARKIVDAHVKKIDDEEYDSLSPSNRSTAREDYSCYRTESWGTDYYKLTIAEVGEVIENDND